MPAPNALFRALVLVLALLVGPGEASAQGASPLLPVLSEGSPGSEASARPQAESTLGLQPSVQSAEGVAQASEPLAQNVEPSAQAPTGPPQSPDALPAPPTEGAEPSVGPVAETAEPPGENRGPLSLLPAIFAIAAALAFRQVVVALFLGVWLGAWIVSGDLAFGWFTGLFQTVQTYVVDALADSDHVAIIVFSLMIGGVVGLIQKNGGTAAIVGVVTRWARTAGRGQLATAFLGTAIFFDDYANTLIVGNTMRPVTDKLQVSREKLAYIVDSTAAPIAALAFATTWVGYQVGLIGEAVSKIPTYDEAPYSIFLNSIPYSFYPILALLFVYLVVGMKRDFGPMLRAERRSRATGQLFRPDSTIASTEAEAAQFEPPPGTRPRLANAVLPIGTLIVGVLVGLYVTGSSAAVEAGEALSFRSIISAADSYAAMMWASLAAVLVAVILSVGSRTLSLEQAVEAWYGGVRSMLLAVIILVLAWSLSGVNDALGTANYLVSTLSGTLHYGLVPAIVFLLAAATSFATGSSWGTMGILMPLVVPLAYGVLAADGLHTEAEYLHILYSSVAAVLGGSVWGDHCSPISDTTILSSLASQCDHIDHVRTQLPYALTVGAVALLLGTLPTAFYVPWWVMLPICAAVLWAVVRFVGQPDNVAPPAAQPPTQAPAPVQPARA